MRLALFRQRSARLPVDEESMRAAWQCASLLLVYPDDETLERLPLVADVAAALPPVVGEPLTRLAGAILDAADRGEIDALRTQFVDTFDITRRCAPYLTYFSSGETRKRGVALVQFKQAYRRAGVEMGDEELPDHLAVVLEFGATVDLQGGLRLLLDHRAGLEVLRLALLDRGSPWADALVAVCATLPALDGEENDAIRKLVEEGPPTESVGLDGYAIDPQLDAPMPASLNPRPPATEPSTTFQHTGATP